MLQFITHPSEKYSIAEEVQMALEGGCKWIQLRLKDASDEEFRAIAGEIIPLCQEAGAFLVFDDRVQLAIEMKVHGVHLGKEDMSPIEARELMGPDAIIGVTANTADDILKLKGQDIDYVGLGPMRFTTTKARLAPQIGIDGYKAIIDKVRSQNMDIHIVAIGGINIADIPQLMATGVSGIAMSGAIINAPDPVSETAMIIETLNNCKNQSQQ